MIPVSNDINFLNAEKASLCKKFEIIDQGEAHFILGMSIRRDRKNQALSIGQPSHIESVLKRFGMENCKPISTPLEAGKKFQMSDDDDPFNAQVYQQVVGCLTYLSTATRPDIAVAVNSLSKYMSSPRKDHWAGVKRVRVLRYLKGTLNFGLKFSVSGKNPQMFGFSDADWAGDLDTRRSTSGYIFQIGNPTVSWSSKMQATAAKSTTEAEYIALSQATQEAVWLRRLLLDLGCSTDLPTSIHEDNQGAIELSKNPKFHNRTKHTDVAYHFVRERISSKELLVTYCPSSEKQADIMTKGLTTVSFQKFRSLLNVHDVLTL